MTPLFILCTFQVSCSQPITVPGCFSKWIFWSWLAPSPRCLPWAEEGGSRRTSWSCRVPTGSYRAGAALALGRAEGLSTTIWSMLGVSRAMRGTDAPLSHREPSPWHQANKAQGNAVSLGREHMYHGGETGMDVSGLLHADCSQVW